jgi:hypothetical protein
LTWGFEGGAIKIVNPAQGAGANTWILNCGTAETPAVGTGTPGFPSWTFTANSRQILHLGRNDMRSHFREDLRFVALLAISLLWTLTSSAAENPTTFTLAVSLHSSIVHVGDDLVLEVITFNTTDHKVFAAQGGLGGLALELLNEKSIDIGLLAMGIPGGKIQEPAGVLASSKEVLRPGSKEHFTWRFKPAAGYVLPGVYKLRVHQRDLTSKTDVYSNMVVLTVAS